MANTFSDQATLVIFDSEESLVHSTETKRPEVHIPDAVVDFLKTDVFPCQGMSDAHPALFPADDDSCLATRVANCSDSIQGT